MAHSSKSILKPERAHATANDTFVFLLELLPIRWLSPDRGTADLDHLEPLRVMHYLHYGRLIIGSLVALIIVRSLIDAVYNAFFHPLAKFPGPRLASISELWYVLTWFGGSSARSISDIHEDFGEVVRIAPNDLSFNTTTAARNIYSHAVHSRPVLLKSADYERTEAPSIATVQSPSEHRRQRAHLSNAFSAEAVRQKEDNVFRYLDRTIEILQSHGHQTGGLDVIPIYTWLTFDIIGQFTFSKDFGATNGNAETQFSTTILFDGVLWGLMPHFFKRMPLWRLLYRFYIPSVAPLRRRQHRALTEKIVDERLRSPPSCSPTRVDFLHCLQQDSAANREELVSQAMIFLAAGSGTVQTALTGATFYLLKYPGTLQKLRAEVRSAFEHSTQITDQSAAKLPYLRAVIRESLRLLPPLPSRLPRVSPGTVIGSHYIPEGSVVSATTYNMSRDPRYRTCPDEFLPERWLVDDQADCEFRNDCQDTSKPFSYGPRACLGVNLAHMELSVILARLVFEFDWILMPDSQGWDEKLKVNFLWKKPPLRVRFLPRGKGHGEA